MPMSDSWLKKTHSSVSFITKDDIKMMTPDQKDELFSAFKKDCLLAASDVQDLIDYTTEVVLVVSEAPIDVDVSKLQMALNGTLKTSEEEAVALDRSEVAVYPTEEENLSEELTMPDEEA